MKKFFSFIAVAFCFCMLTTTFVSCGDDKADNPNPENNQNADSDPAPAPATAAVTKADLIGAWDVWANGAPFVYTFTDDKLTIKTKNLDPEQTIFDGVYTFENERLSYVLDGETASMNIEMIHNKTVMLAISIIPADQSYSGEEERQTSFAYRQGTEIPVTAADIQGKWYWQSEHGFVGARAVLILNGNQFDLTITPWAERHTGTFTYVNGYIHLTPEHSYICRTDAGDLIDEAHPENSQWRVPGSLGPDDYYSPSYFGNPGDDVIPFIPNGTKAYSELANLQVEYTKQ